MRTTVQLRHDALRIWRAAVQAVDAARLVRAALRVDGVWLHAGDRALDLSGIGRIAVVGAGKAGAAMAAAVEEVLQPWAQEKQLSGWVNVPDDCVRPLKYIRLHGARPPGVNEPTLAGVRGSEEILQIVSQLRANDLCLCLISGGGSALLPAPVPGISLHDKLQVTRTLSSCGANIRQLNTVRKQLSRIKGGGLLRACRAGHLVGLILSDVLGDPLDIIASGPTVPDRSTPQEALQILQAYGADEGRFPEAVLQVLRRKMQQQASAPPEPQALTSVTNLVIGNNGTAVGAAGAEAVRLGYATTAQSTNQLEGPAEEVAAQLARTARQLRQGSGPAAWISGGEPVVHLAPPEIRGRGGRNQQLVLAALRELLPHGLQGIVLLSGGTDGEDGPTDAAGAWIDAELPDAARAAGIDSLLEDVDDHLRRNDAYTFFDRVGTLLRTGPTHTNVCDVRVVLVEPRSR
jgi:glycerate 2-kinase